VQGGATDASPRDQLEVDLDLEIAHSVAPQAQLLNYEAPLAGNVLIGPALDTIVAQHRADIVSISWGQCERSYRSGEIQRDNQSILAADAAGISIFVASGDQGAYDCQALNPSDQHLSVDWPGGSPGVIDVGGTSLSVAQGGGYAGEDAWEGVLSQRGSGGGLDASFARPSWQTGPGVQNQFSSGKRQVPDVSADADVATGWAVEHSGQLLELGGTSAAAPFWAASMLLIRQYAQRQGTGPLGFVNPMLYQIASTPQSFPAFHDVTVGGNRFYQASPGWDFATGLGSPDVYNLGRDVVLYLRRHGH
jgi:kumamolisin